MDDILIAQDGSRIACSIEGNGPCLFLVGAPVGIRGFSQLASVLRDRFTVVLHDPRGIGLSTNNATGQISPQLLASDLAALIQRIATGKVLIFGASGGAVTAIELLCHHAPLLIFLLRTNRRFLSCCQTIIKRSMRPITRLLRHRTMPALDWKPSPT